MNPIATRGSELAGVGTSIEPIAVGHDGIQALLGGIKISNTTRWRWEKAGKIERVPGIRPPIYTVASIKRLVAGKGAA